MKDLYKRLNVSEGATEEQIRQRLPAAGADVRADAETILLEPRRRRVYDRNRQLLVTIAQLRFELGLNYTRFWSRREFKDFWRAPADVFSATPIPEQKPKRRVDKVMIAQAFHTARKVHHHGRHHVARWGWAWAVAGATGVLTFLILVLWHLSY